MPCKVLIPEAVAREGIDFLLQKGYEVKMGRGYGKEVLIEDLQDCDAVIVRVAAIDEEVLQSCPRLKVIAKHGVGVDAIDLQAAKAHGCRVVYTPGANTLSVAEHAMALISACARCLPFSALEYAKGNYSVKDQLPSIELSGKTLGLIGAGRIATEVARIAKFGYRMRVIAYDPYLPADFCGNVFERADHRETVFRESDFVSLHIPATGDTVKSVGEKEFALMKPTAILINTARGTLVDERALIRALEEGRIAGAGLDVSDPEPAAPDNPLFRMKQVVLTPHCGAATRESMVRMSVDAAKGIDEVLSGREPTYPVQ